MTAGSDQRSLLTYVHACDGTVMKSLVYILENYLFVRYVVDEIRNLRDELVDVQSGYIVVSERNGYDVLLKTYADVGHLSCTLSGGCPFPRQLQ